jgi:hypothetical protein
MALVRAATFSPVIQSDTFEIQRQKINALAVDVDAGLIDGLQYPYIYSLKFTVWTNRQLDLVTPSCGIPFPRYWGEDYINEIGENFFECGLTYDVIESRYMATREVLGTTLPNENIAAGKLSLGAYGDAARSIVMDFLHSGGEHLVFKKATFLTIAFAISPNGPDKVPKLLTHTYNVDTGYKVTNDPDSFVTFDSAPQGGYPNEGGQYLAYNGSGRKPALYISAIRGARGQNAVHLIGQQNNDARRGVYALLSPPGGTANPPIAIKTAFSSFTTALS